MWKEILYNTDDRTGLINTLKQGGTINSPEPKKGKTFVRKEEKIGRNDPCPCGSGKKYKKCCGA